MRKRIVIIILLIILVIGLLYGDYIIFNLPKNNNQNNVIQEADATQDIDGTILDATMHTITISSNNSVLTFLKDDADKTEADAEYIGNEAIITYEGTLDMDEEVQTAKVTKIKTINTQNIGVTEEPDQTILTDEGIFSDYYDAAYTKLKTMTLDEKIGQLFLVRVPSDNATDVVKAKQFGGYILFGRDTKNVTKDELIAKINDWNSVSKIPLLIATDEEGGTVVRISNNANLAPYKFKSPHELFLAGGYEAIKEDTITKNNLLASLGINLNLAPVSDVSTDPDDYIYNRAFGYNASKTATYVETVINASKETKTSNTLKHFPGYGNNLDTHTGISIDNRSYDNFVNNDFVPFEAGIKAGAESILVSHNIIVNIENNLPASLSPKIHNLLRNKLGFTGIIMTDDLAMDAIKDYVSNPSIAALKAGNDLIIITNYEEGIKNIKDALNNKEITENIIDKAVLRVLAWKYYKGMIEE